MRMEPHPEARYMLRDTARRHKHQHRQPNLMLPDKTATCWSEQLQRRAQRFLGTFSIPHCGVRCLHLSRKLAFMLSSEEKPSS